MTPSYSHDPRLLWMRSFVALVEADSFSAAARHAGVAQSTMSKHLAALETHLGVRLFHRTTRRRALTDEGAHYFEQARRIIDAVDLADHSVSTARVSEGVIRITLPLTLARARVIAMLGDFMAAHPGIRIDLRISDHALNLVADHIDVALRVGRLVDSSLVARNIGVARRMLVASPAYLIRAGTPKTPADLAGHNCLGYSLLASGPLWTFGAHGSVKVAGTLMADSPDALAAAALAGIGIVANATWLFEDDLAAGRLVPVLADYPLDLLPIAAVLPFGRLVAARTRALITYLGERFAADPLLRSP
jgi:LysR family transcriptional regulator, regulator for bpeEF and oprC